MRMLAVAVVVLLATAVSSKAQVPADSGQVAAADTAPADTLDERADASTGEGKGMGAFMGLVLGGFLGALAGGDGIDGYGFMFGALLGAAVGALVELVVLATD